MEGITLTVSQLNDYVRRLLASDPIVQHITLRGEISYFKPYASGHWYFTLKDDTGRIDCALFRQYTYGVPFMPQDGMRVLVKGSAGLYVQGGKFQFYADGMKINRLVAVKTAATCDGTAGIPPRLRNASLCDSRGFEASRTANADSGAEK